MERGLLENWRVKEQHILEQGIVESLKEVSLRISMSGVCWNLAGVWWTGDCGEGGGGG